ncbi:MAG TPA: prolyl oligopeptidase family serine peptidase [Chitinophagaceae bacterium]|nr:prolyl oligopeptidase family serine peptidase [Chitinophagaceae bacterium]
MRLYKGSLLLLLFIAFAAQAQKKPLDHSVYDGWQSIGERVISNDGRYVVYTINLQEGDGVLVVQATDNSYKKEIPRGYNATISTDNKFVVCRVRPFFKDTREARIKKKRPDDMPKDSLFILNLSTDSLTRISRVKGYKMPEKGAGWVAYHLDKALPEPPKPRQQPDSVTQINNLTRMVDSLSRVVDSLRAKVNDAKTKGIATLQPPKREDRKPPARPAEDPVEEGTELVLRNLLTGEEKKFKLVNDYIFSEKGNALVVKTTRKNNDSLTNALVLWVSPSANKVDTVMRKFNDAKSFSFDTEGTQLAFVAERDSVAKALRKFYKLWYYTPGSDSARLRVDRNTAGVERGLTVNDFANIQFSKDGNKLFFQLAPIRPVKDTNLVDFETARLDIWHYNDDYLQPQQLRQVDQELRRGFTAVMHKGDSKVVRLGNDSSENIVLVNEGNADYVLGTSNKNGRVALQWQGFALQNSYIISTADGSRRQVAKGNRGSFAASPRGKYVVWYDWRQKQWFTYNVANGTTASISKAIKVPVWDEEDDHPDDPPPHGLMRWHEDDRYVYLYDKYDIWRCDPDGKETPMNMTAGVGRKHQVSYRYIFMDREERFVRDGQQILLDVFDNKSKESGLHMHVMGQPFTGKKPVTFPLALTGIVKSKNSDVITYLTMSPSTSPNVTISKLDEQVAENVGTARVLSSINPQQKDYNWYTVELHKWKMFDGKMSEGLLFKPENFDSTKKYPVIFYFYEKDADTRYNYRTPSPSASTINIPYFVSNGYIVFDPNIYYKNGEPGESAYNSIVSAAKYLSKMKWVDSTKMAIQGQSWGGYQVAYLVTRTNIFAAAGAGAPVANMTSAYGGIRWGTGLNRQFQYERSQSRLGGTLWQKQDLYIKNSPLFKADKVKTPLLIMHNDADGAVPWYQGIELFTALRRLGKQVWMLQYNGEDHNLVERRNRKDLSIRLAQFFDHYLKGAPAAKWIRDGVPATLKGIDWGTTAEEKKGF